MQLSTRLTLILGLALSTPALSQPTLSPAHGNYHGLGEVLWNPATVADSRYLFQLQLFSLDVTASNTAYAYTGPWSLKNPGSGLEFSPEYLTLRNDKPRHLVGLGLDARGPGLQVRLNANNGLAFQTRVRTAFQGNAVSASLLQDAVNEFEGVRRSDDNTFNFNMNAFAEWNLTYGRTVINDEAHFLKAGITLKRLIGLGAAYIQSRQLDYEILPDNATTGDTVLRLHRFEGGAGFSNPSELANLDLNTARRWLTKGSGPGSGWGADLGVVYEFRPDHATYYYTTKKGERRPDASRNKYKYRVSVALTDIGGIRYRTNAAAYDVTASNLGVSQADLEGIDEDNVEERIRAILRTDRYEEQTSFRMGLPTTLNVDVDYHLSWKFYLNAAVRQNLRGRFAPGMRTFSYASVTPRLETRWLEVATPVLLTNNYRTAAFGVSARAGIFLLGTNDLGSLLGGKNRMGSNVYFGVSPLSWANWRPSAKSRKSKVSKVAPALKQPVTPPATPATSTPAAPDSLAAPVSAPVTAPTDSLTTPAAAPATAPADSSATPAATPTTVPTTPVTPAQLRLPFFLPGRYTVLPRQYCFSTRHWSNQYAACFRGPRHSPVGS
ncbi:hypothetical protein FY528_17985 [Hymenobacter lutimineralis]|uniref:DUF5723 domain-containing protein n=1 Tax=Hymenobacter lutimineralis TaxID=2606448 RepID=A0A5D6UTX4_9BACT|nr:DUF5723 family protein [Hymenobacter lutimineralis]TYZ06405.1 hypothetical protein FY528_17985 [Hymenobacter lutimineralis]